MTAAGHVALEDELRHRTRIARPRLVQRIQHAISDDANLVENSEYQAALAEQEVNENRIADLEDKLARAEIIDVSKLSGDTISFGATVTLIDEDTPVRSGSGRSSASRKPTRAREDFSDFTDRQGIDRKDQRHNDARRSSSRR
jgi:hypothetical protein